jgi:hypothetical protein
LFVERLTEIPPGPAKPLRFTVPVEALPPTIEDGFRVTDAKVPGMIVRLAVCVRPVSVPEMATAVWVFTPPVFTGKVALACPAAMVTEAGTVAVELALERAITAPPAPAGLLRVTVPVVVPPAVTVAGFRVSEISEAGVMVSVAVCEVPP